MHTERKSWRRGTQSILFASLFVLAFARCAQAQTAAEALPDAPQAQTQAQSQNPTTNEITVCDTPLNVVKDQKGIWTKSFRIHPHDLVWLAPLTLATGAAIATDHRALKDVVSTDPSFNNASTNTSNVMIGGFIAAPVAIYGFGHFHQSEHAREAGLLSAEALLDGLVVEQGMKFIFWRERPNVDSERGRFFQTSAGWDSSFPSSHSVVAWSTASAIATEYPRTWTRILVYSGATGVSLTRVLGQQHFPSDVLVGSAAGWLIGRYVVRHHYHWRYLAAH